MRKMTLNLSKEIYQKSSIMKAIKDYKQLARIQFGEDEHHWRLDFQESRYDMQNTVSEFENYLIGIEQ